jgi:hypothetical protein
MTKFISNIPRYSVSYKYGAINVTRFVMPETRFDLPRPVNNRPGYDMDYVRAYWRPVFSTQAIAANQEYVYRYIE